MKQYLEILRNILENGKEKVAYRKQPDGSFVAVDDGNPTIGLSNIVISHNMCNGFPLLTTKQMAYKSMVVELEGFIKGITSKYWYKEKKCNIWNEWCNPLKLKYRLYDIAQQKYKNDEDIEKEYNRLKKDTEIVKQIQLEEDDLGPIYGYQWRHFAQVYNECDDGPIDGVDQFKNMVDTLRENPMDRRMIVSAWNPKQMNQMALPPCHLMYIVSVYKDEVSLHWTQR